MLGNILITLLVGCMGGMICLRMKIPAGGIVGAMIAVAAFNVLTSGAVFPWYSKVMTQSIAGAFIAVPLTLHKIKMIRTILKPAIIITVGMLLISIGMAFLCVFVSPIDLITAFLSASPGGMSDVILISADLGADPLQVSLIHSIRLFLVLSVFPAADKHLADYLKHKRPDIYAVSHDENMQDAHDGRYDAKSGLNLMLSLLVTFAGGYLGYLIGVPAGALIFSMASMCVFNIVTGRGYIPLKLRRFAQICVGTMIGSGITMDNLRNAKYVLIPILIIISGNIVINMLLGLLVFHVTDLDLLTSLFATIPAGVADMALLADELSGDGFKVALLQTVRFVACLTIYPQVYLFICSLF